MVPEGSFQLSQEHATYPCSEPDESSPYSTILFLFIVIHFNITLPSTVRSFKWSLYCGFPTSILCVRAKCFVRLVLGFIIYCIC
jgi:hypothetical protein